MSFIFCLFSKLSIFPKYSCNFNKSLIVILYLSILASVGTLPTLDNFCIILVFLACSGFLLYLCKSNSRLFCLFNSANSFACPCPVNLKFLTSSLSFTYFSLSLIHLFGICLFIQLSVLMMCSLSRASNSYLVLQGYSSKSSISIHLYFSNNSLDLQ